LDNWQSDANGGTGCVGFNEDAPGFVTGGNRVFLASPNLAPAKLANSATAKITYDFRML